MGLGLVMGVVRGYRGVQLGVSARSSDHTDPEHACEDQIKLVYLIWVKIKLAHFIYRSNIDT